MAGLVASPDIPVYSAYVLPGGIYFRQRRSSAQGEIALALSEYFLTSSKERGGIFFNELLNLLFAIHILDSTRLYVKWREEAQYCIEFFLCFIKMIYQDRATLQLPEMGCCYLERPSRESVGFVKAHRVVFSNAQTLHPIIYK